MARIIEYTEVEKIGPDGSVGKLTELSSVTAKPIEPTDQLAKITGLTSQQSAAELKLPSLNFTGIPGPKLASTARLIVPISSSAPKLALESDMREVEKSYVLRDPKQRAKLLERLGGTEESEASVSRALNWLSRNQEPDGRWNIHRHGGQKGQDVAATSFALLCYFGWGARHNQPGPYKNTVDKALKWLVSQMRDDSRYGPGAMGFNMHNSMYGQGVATLALAEAYGLSKDPALLEYADKAVHFVMRAQNPNGGWDYSPYKKGANNTTRTDTSVSGWQLMALKSAKLAGIHVPDSHFQRCHVWLDRVSTGKHKGIYGYDAPALRNGAMLAEGMFSQQLLDKYPPSHPRMKESAEKIMTVFMPKANSGEDLYYWYYGSLAAYMHKGELWEKWNPVMRDLLLSKQVKSGVNAGSWNPKGSHGSAMGRVISTAMATLILEVYYRYLPSATSGSASVPKS